MGLNHVTFLFLCLFFYIIVILITSVISPIICLTIYSPTITIICVVNGVLSLFSSLQESKLSLRISRYCNLCLNPLFYKSHIIYRIIFIKYFLFGYILSILILTAFVICLIIDLGWLELTLLLFVFMEGF